MISFQVPPSPPALVESYSVSTEPQLLESQVQGKIEYRRYSFPSKNLPQSEGIGAVSFIRTSAAWKNSELIKKTIYYFHAGNTSDHLFVDLGGLKELESFDAKKSLDEVQVVCPMTANSFMTGPFQAWFETSVSPWAEANTQTDTRFTAGVSMGGFVALSEFFSHPDRYVGVFASAPSILTWDVFSPNLVVAYGERTKIGLPTAQALAGYFLAAFSSREMYEQKDPISLAAKLNLNTLKNKMIYLGVGENDDLGLQEGTAALHLELEALHPQVSSFEVKSGAHHDAPYFAGQITPMLQFLLAQ